MTQQTVRITEITPPPPNTRQPWKFKDGNGLVLKTFSPQIGRLIQDHQGEPLTLDYETQVSGNYTDNIVKSAVVAEVKPEVRPNGQPTGTGWRPDPSRDMKDSEKNAHIIRESCLSSAVALAVGMIGTRHDPMSDDEEEQFILGTLALMRRFEAAIYESSPKISGKVDEAVVQEVFPGATLVGEKARGR